MAGMLVTNVRHFYYSILLDSGIFQILIKIIPDRKCYEFHTAVHTRFPE
jgi:hypothetical protein